MKFKEYIELAARTDANLGDKDRLHWLIGLYNEFGETMGVIKKSIVKGNSVDTNKLTDEVGDCCWYLAKGMRVNSFELPKDYAYEPQSNILNLIATFNQFWAREDVMGLYCCLVDLCDLHSIDFKECLQKNINKLNVRHKEGFDINNPKHTEEERKIVEE